MKVLGSSVSACHSTMRPSHAISSDGAWAL